MPSIYPNDYRSVIAALVRKRKEKRITQMQMAISMRVTQSFISKVERGERRLDVVEILRMCELLDIPLSDVISSVPRRLMPINGSDTTT